MKTLKRDYVAGADLRDAESVLLQLAEWIEDYNTRRPWVILVAARDKQRQEGASMGRDFKELLWEQFGAAIDMLENAIDACPDEVWSDPSKKPEWLTNDVVGYWYLVYHTLFFLDFDMSDVPEGEFRPPAPFNLDELDPAGLLPDKPYTKEELRAYLEYGRRKCRAVIAGFDAYNVFERKAPTRPDKSVAELLLYSMRHVQHHTAQLNLILRQRTGTAAPRWVSKAREPLQGAKSPTS